MKIPVAQDISNLAPELLTPFLVRRLTAPNLVWLNDRYFQQQGIDVTLAHVFADIRNWLLTTYGVMTPDGAGINELQTGPCQTMYADRYGGSNGAVHGGSGRCGIVGDFNAKGIGKTPLVAKTDDWSHSHGLLWLSEAIREAICAEIADAELPYGAVPIIAIIDTQIDFQRDIDTPPERCAIVVRPNIIRPAHFERSIYFGTSGFEGSDQQIDALRVTNSIRNATGNTIFQLPPTREMFLRFARQLGAGRALRLWPGRFLTSNVSIDGALLDFGAFRSVANWRRAIGQPGEAFGDESAHFSNAISSLLFYFNKHSANGYEVPSKAALLNETLAEINVSFKETLMDCLGLYDGEIGCEIVEAALAYYDVQQAQRVKVDNPNDLRRAWIYDHFTAKTGYDAPEAEVRAANRLYSSICDVEQKLDGSTIEKARQWFRPRPHLYLDIAIKGAVSVQNRLKGNELENRDFLSNFINRQIARCRRRWRNVPSYFQIITQSVKDGTSALWGYNHQTKTNGWWIEAPRNGNTVYAFRKTIPLEDDSILNSGISSVGFFCSGDIKNREVSCMKKSSIKVELPETALHFRL